MLKYRIKKSLLLFSIIIIFTQCNFVKKYLDFNKGKVIICYDEEYLSTYEGKILNKIVKDFLKNKKKKYIKINKNNMIKKLEKNKVNIILTKLPVTEKNIKYKIIISDPVLRNAVYFLIHEENTGAFKYPYSLYSLSAGMLYQSDVYEYIINKFKQRDNFSFYTDINNLIDDFKRKKINLLLINRSQFYKNIYTIPAKNILYINIGNPYGTIIFTDNNLNNDFKKYINNKKDKYEWLDLYYKKPKEIKILDKLVE